MKICDYCGTTKKVNKKIITSNFMDDDYDLCENCYKSIIKEFKRKKDITEIIINNKGEL